MGLFFINIADGEPSDPVVWNTRLQGIEDAILSSLNSGSVKTIIPWTIIGSDTLTLTISSIPQTHRHLLLQMNMIVDIGGGGPGEIAMMLWANSDSSAGVNERGSWTTVSTASAADPTKGLWFSANKDKTAKPTPASISILIPNYTSSYYQKQAFSSVFLWRDSASSYREFGWARFALSASAPITSLSMTEQAGSFNINSNTGFSILGIGNLS